MFFDTPIAAVFMRAGDSPLFRSGVGLDDQASLEIQGICSRVMDDNAPLILRDLSDQYKLPSFFKHRTFSGLRFCVCLPIGVLCGRPIAAISIGDIEAKPEFSEADIANLGAFSAIAADIIMCQLVDKYRHASASEVTVVAHDIRTPMNGVIGMAELLLVSKDLCEKQRRRAETIKRSGVALLSMIDPIFDIARAELKRTVNPSISLNLRDFVVDSFERAQSKFTYRKQALSLACDLPLDLGALVDEDALQRLLSHFFEGVIALGVGAPVRVEAACETAASKVMVTLSGIDVKLKEEKLNRLIALLSYESDAAAGNLGSLGLKLLACSWLARAMDGELVACRLAPDRTHLKLEICLPPAPLAGGLMKAPSSENGDDNAGEENNRSINVLVAEDDPDMASLIKEFLEDVGHRVTVAPSGAEVMKALDEEAVDIVLMDGRLLDMSGLEVAGNIRALSDVRANLPIIALTGDVMNGDRERYLSAGMNDYLAKPVEYEAIIKMINQYK